MADEMNRLFLAALLLLDVVGVGRSGGVGTPKITVLGQGAPATTTSGITEEVLATVTVPAGKVTTDGAMVSVVIFAHGNGNGACNFRVRVGGIGGTVIHDTGNFAVTGNDQGTMEPVYVQRSSATTATAQGKFNQIADKTPGAGGNGQFTAVTAASITWANQQDWVITGLSSVAGNVVLDSYQVVLYQ